MTQTNWAPKKSGRFTTEGEFPMTRCRLVFILASAAALLATFELLQVDAIYSATHGRIEFLLLPGTVAYGVLFVLSEQRVSHPAALTAYFAANYLFCCLLVWVIWFFSPRFSCLRTPTQTDRQGADGSARAPRQAWRWKR
jgi:hypothetical protein